MKTTYERLEREGQIGPMENTSTDPQRTILQPRKGFRGEYPKLVVVGQKGNKPLKRLVQNSHEELMLRATGVEPPNEKDLENSLMAQQVASLMAEKRALEEKLRQMEEEKKVEEKSRGPNVSTPLVVAPNVSTPIDPSKKAASVVAEFKEKK